MSVWEDMYGISVHARHQTTKENISEILKGFQKEEDTNGYEILTVHGWDYPALVDTYAKASQIARTSHIPVLIHVKELTQPQGHSTSGSHERYKSPERLQWESEFDCIAKMRSWMIESSIATAEELDTLDAELKKDVLNGKKAAWEAYLNPIKEERASLIAVLNQVASSSANKVFIEKMIADLNAIKEPIRKDNLTTARKILRMVVGENGKDLLANWIKDYIDQNQPKFSSHLMSQSSNKSENITEISPVYDENSTDVDARLIIRDNFDKIFETYPEALIFGEDSGNIGDVNQGLEGLQEKYGESRVADAGIREASILGQGIGMAMRGLRPIAEIQYLDYLLYALQIMSDDLATVQYRTAGKQKAPLIVRTRGHRLEGIWHSGSPMGMIINAVRGMHVLVPRNMTKAAGFSITL